MRIKVLFILINSIMVTVCYGQKKIKPIVIKIGLSHTTQQWGYSPFDHIRPIERSIQSSYLYVGYNLIRRNKYNFIGGLQYVEKGFRVNYSYYEPGIYKHEMAYQNLLQYIELPIIYTYHHQKFSYSTGILFSYLVNDIYSYFDKVTSTNLSTYITTQTQVSYETSYNKLYNRINKHDFGIVVGTTYNLTKDLGIDFTIQKHFLQVDNWKQRDLVYNLVFLLGMKVNI